VLQPATVSGRLVSLSWAPGPGGPPSSYVLVAALSMSGPIVATLPLTSTSFSVEAPPGTYYLAVLPVSSAGTGPPSNIIAVSVP
jgi:hypothetical protein